VSELLLVTGVLEPSSEVLPALGLLLHSVRVLPADASALVEAPPADVVLVDARRDLAHAKSICRLLHTTGSTARWSPSSPRAGLPRSARSGTLMM
jgi:transcription regulator GlnR-like protein